MAQSPKSSSPAPKSNTTPPALTNPHSTQPALTNPHSTQPALTNRKITAPVSRIVVWEEGEPKVVAAVSSSAAFEKIVADVSSAALLQPYDNENDPEYSGSGLTCLEVIMIKGAQEAAGNGDLKQLNAILDRAIGKPKSNNANNTNPKNTALNYADFLDSVGKNITPASISPAPLPPTPISPAPSQSLNYDLPTL